MDKTVNGEARGGVISRSQLYSVASAHSREAIDTLVDLMRTCRVPSIKLGAAKALLDKCLPDLRAEELSASNHNDGVVVRIVAEGGFMPPRETMPANVQFESSQQA